MEITQQTKNKIGMPLLGFGTYQMSVDQAASSVFEAIKAGFRHIDSAQGYHNEEGTGKGIKKALDELGLRRENLFITTKLFPGYKAWGTPEKNFEQTVASLKDQLSQLGLEYVDLYLIHAPFSELRIEQWKALVELKKFGLAKHIGVSNYNEQTIQEILDAGLDLPEVNQIEFHPICTRASLTKFMRDKGIEPVAYSSLAPLSTWRVDEGQGGEVLSDIKKDAQSVIKEIATKLNVSEAQLLLRWGMQHGYAVLTKSSHVERIKSNLEVFTFEIPEEDMQALDALNQDRAIAWAANGLNPMETVPPLATGKKD